jgi:hypothetical protein
MSVQTIGASNPPTTPPAEVDTSVTVTVPVKGCCGVLAGDECECAAFAAEARGMFATGRVIMCRPASQWGV